MIQQGPCGTIMFKTYTNLAALVHVKSRSGCENHSGRRSAHVRRLASAALSASTLVAWRRPLAACRLVSALRRTTSLRVQLLISRLPLQHRRPKTFNPAALVLVKSKSSCENYRRMRITRFGGLHQQFCQPLPPGPGGGRSGLQAGIWSKEDSTTAGATLISRLPWRHHPFKTYTSPQPWCG